MSKRVGVFEITLQIEVTDEDIRNILITAYEGGINYWCSGVDGTIDDLLNGKKITVIENEEGDYEEHEISLVDVMQAIKDVAKDVPYILYNGGYVNEASIDCAQIDSCIADSIVQTAVFGEVVYG